MSDNDMTPEEYEEHVSGYEVDQERINDLEAQVARLQGVIKRWAKEDYPEGQEPDWASLEYMQGLDDGDLTPP